MDRWQDSLLNEMHAFAGEAALHSENEVHVCINVTQAYVIMKALEDQESYHALLKVRHESRFYKKVEGNGQ